MSSRLCVGAWTTAVFHARVSARLGLGLDLAAFSAGWNDIFGPPTAGIDALLDALAPRARLAVFLCMPESHNITGTAIPIDGGWTAQ